MVDKTQGIWFCEDYLLDYGLMVILSFLLSGGHKLSQENLAKKKFLSFEEHTV